MSLWLLVTHVAYFFTSLFYFLNYRKINNKIPWEVGYILVLSFLFEFTVYILSLYKINSSYTFALYDLIVGSLVVLMLLKQLVDTTLKKLGFVFTGLYLIIAVTETIGVYVGRELLTNFSIVSLCVLTLYLSMVYYYQIIIITQTVLIHKQPIFWVVTACFLLFGGTFFLYLFQSYLPENVGDQWIYEYIWPIQNISTILFSSTILYAIWTARRA